MVEKITNDPLKGRHAIYSPDAEGNPVVIVHQHIRHSLLETGSVENVGRVWGSPLVEVQGGKFEVGAATNLFASLATGMEKALEWKEDEGKAVMDF